MSDCAACDALGVDATGAPRLCDTHQRRNLHAIAVIRALHAGDPRWERPGEQLEPGPP
jgi:hypothetical protein